MQIFDLQLLEMLRGTNLSNSTQNILKNIEAGYYSIYGATTSRPADLLDVRGECPEGFACPAGTVHPISCAEGYYRKFSIFKLKLFSSNNNSEIFRFFKDQGFFDKVISAVQFFT